MEKITTVRNALTFLLRGLYDAHRELRDALPFILANTSSQDLHVELSHHLSKLPAIMNTYPELFKVLHEPLIVRKNASVFNLLHDLRSRLSIDDEVHMKDEQILRTIKIIAELQKADIITSVHFARELDLKDAIAILLKELDDTNELVAIIEELENSSRGNNRPLALVG